MEVSMTEKELRQLRDGLANMEEELGKTAERYYYRLAESERLGEEDRQDLYDEVAYESVVLDVGATYLKKTYQNFSATSDELQTRMRDIERSRKKRRIIKAAPANSVIDLKEEQTDHFAKGLNIYKVLLVFFIGSLGGVIVENIWCFLTQGFFESRAGLVYGPLNMLYGAGAVVLMAALYRYRNRNALISFFGGMLVGSVVEYSCSWLQEMIFGSRSWDYSWLPFNLNGRICLLYSVFWGFLGVYWIKRIYPRIAKWILKIPNKAGKIATWVLLVFFILDGAVTSAAVMRWSERIDGEPPSNVIEEIMDDRFPDERMRWIFPNMKFN